MSRPRARRPALPLAIATVAVAAALAVLLPAAVPDAAHAQATPPTFPPIGNYTAGDGDGQFNIPAGIAMYRDGTIVVADTFNHRVQVFSPNGTFLFKFGSEGSGTGEFSYPLGVSLTRDGRIIVADTFNHRVQVFHPNGTHALTFGSEGRGTGEFWRPAGAVQGWSNDFIVADTGNHRVQTFFSNGTFAFMFGSRGNGSYLEFESPTAVLGPEPTGASSSGTLIVADTGNNRVLMFGYYSQGPYGRAVSVWGGNPLGVPGDGAREFASPRSLDWSTQAQFIVADTGNHRIQQLSEGHGRAFDFTFGSKGTGPGQFMSPVAAAMNRAGVLAVADSGNHRVQVFHPNLTLAYVLGLPTNGSGTGNGTAVTPPDPAPDPAPTGEGNGTCSIELGSPSLNLHVAQGTTSPAARQVVSNTGSLDLAGIAIDATPWYVDPPPGDPPFGVGRPVATMPPSLTELAVAAAGTGAVAPRTFAPLSADGSAPPTMLPLAAGLPPEGEYSLWFRINLDGRPAAPAGAGTLVQYTTFVAECPTPAPDP